MPVDTMQALAEEMERQKLNLEKLGFSFGDRKFPIDVHLRKWLIGSSENGRYWRWPRPLSSNLSTVNLNQNLFTSPRLEAMHIASRTDGDTPWNRMVRIAGHELLHLVQYYGYQKSWSTYHWLDEAIAVWYELYAVSDIYRGEMKYGGILPDAAAENLDFIYTPLYFPDKPEKHGYGASMFVTYMVNELQDPLLPARIVGEASRLDYADSYPGVALQNALSGGNRSVGDLWHGFLEQYLVYPSEGFAGFNTSSLWKGDLRLKSQGRGTDNDPYRYSFTGEKGLEGVSASTETVEHPQGQEAKIALDFKLGGLSAYPFKLNLEGSAAGEPVEIRVNLTSDSVFMAVQVYGIPAGGGAPLKLACASDPVIAWTGTGSRSTGGAFDELLFIVMNTDDARIRTKEEINCNLEISIGPSDVDIEGTWIGEMVPENVHYSGELTLRGVTYHADQDLSALGRKEYFAVQITRNEQGSYTFESDISIQSHSITGTAISFALGWRRSGEYIRFNGVLDESGQTISGTFEGGHDDYGVMVSGSWTLRKQQ